MLNFGSGKSRGIEDGCREVAVEKELGVAFLGGGSSKPDGRGTGLEHAGMFPLGRQCAIHPDLLGVAVPDGHKMVPDSLGNHARRSLAHHGHGMGMESDLESHGAARQEEECKSGGIIALVLG